jgi:hypothetical protein
MSYLCYLYLFAHSSVQHILCCVFVLFFFIYVASFSELSLTFNFDKVNRRRIEEEQTIRCQKIKDSWTSNNLQNTKQKTNDISTRTPLKNTGVTSGAPE